MQLTIILLLCCVHLVHATISKSFYQHIVSNYGKATAQLVARTDFGASGSYGGGNHEAGRKTPRIPVVFVHGMATKASTTLSMAKTFQSLGYSDEELYATTYGTPGPGGFPLQVAMRCNHVKGVRAMIKAVASYTNSQVNVVTYSLGGPISRKAILGGKCVDTNEDLGPALTGIVDTYLDPAQTPFSGVAGPQHGAVTCGANSIGICNRINGIGCGSQFLNDINSRSRYEGSKIYVLQSQTDEIVGLNSCGQRSSEIRGSDQTVTLSGLGHVQTCASTARVQYNLLNKGTQ